jgi:hypothetical protein
MQKQGQNISHLFDSFLIVPAIPAALGAVSVGVDIWPGTWDGFVALLMVFVVAYLIGIVHTLFLGVPAFLLGLRLHAIYWWSCLLVGFLIGGLPMTIWMKGTWLVFLAWGFLGAMGGFGFWLLWRFWVRWDLQVET